ncbi:hypothetical protein BGZ49_006753, partial [Haplosporangium sp. Z 27]
LSALFAKVHSGYLDEVLQNSGNYRFILDGKSFLKRLTTVEMYVDHPEWNEGIMTNERTKQISKKAILKAFNLKGRNEIARLDGNKIDDNSCLNFVWSAIGVALERGDDLGIEMSNQLLGKWLSVWSWADFEGSMALRQPEFRDTLEFEYSTLVEETIGH